MECGVNEMGGRRGAEKGEGVLGGVWGGSRLTLCVPYLVLVVKKCNPPCINQTRIAG